MKTIKRAIDPLNIMNPSKVGALFVYEAVETNTGSYSSIPTLPRVALIVIK